MPQRVFGTSFLAKLYMVSTGKAVLKIAQYKFGSNPLDTVVRAKVRKTAQAISDPALILAVYFENAPVI
jgi:hypothetical protein